MLVLIDGKNLPTGRHHLHLQYLVRSKAVRWRENRVASSGDETSSGDRLTTTTDDGSIDRIRSSVDVVHLSSRANSDCCTGDDGVAAIELKLIVVDGNRIEVVRPDG